MYFTKQIKWFCIAIFCLIANVAYATPSPMPMMQSTTNQVISALQQNKATLKTQPQMVYNIVHRILLPHVYLDGMAQVVLGANVWNSATPQQRQEFTQQFTELLIHTYSSALAAYQDQEVRFYPLRTDLDGKTRIQVNSAILQQGGPSISVNYRLIFLNGEWKVYDFSVDGVSMLESFRSQFATELSNGSLDALIKKLAAHNAQAKSV